MSFTLPSGGLPVSLLAGVGAEGSGRMGGPGLERGLPDSFLHPSSAVLGSHSSPQLLSQLHQGESTGFGDPFASGEGGSRAGPLFSGLLFKGLRGHEGLGRLAPDNRSLHSESSGDLHFIPYGDTSVGSEIGSFEGLDGLSRSPGRIPPDPCPSGISEVSEVCDSGRDLPVQGPPLRPHNLSSGLHQGHGSCIGYDASFWVPNAQVLGRLAHSGVNPGGSGQGEGLPSSFMCDIRYQDKFQEVSAGADTDSDIPRDEDSIYSFEGFSNSREDSEVFFTARRIQVLSGAARKLMEEPSGPDVFPLSPRPGVSSENEVPSAPSGSELGLLRRQGDDCLGRFLPGGSSVVVRRIKSDPRGTTGVLRAGDAPLHGRVRSRLGSNLGGLPSFRPLVSRGSSHVHQCSGTDSSSESNSKLRHTPSISQSGSLLRQYDSSILSQEVRRDPLIHAELNCSRNPARMRSSIHHTDATIYSRSPKRDGRCSEQGETGLRIRMDPVSTSVPGHPETLACEYRSICYQPESQTPSVLFTSSGSSSSGNRCDAPELGRHGGICLPSFLDDLTSAPKAETVHKLPDHTNSSILAPETMVRGTPGTSGGGPSISSKEDRPSQATPLQQASSEPPRLRADCVESLKLSAKHVGLSSAVAGQLALCRRKSTRLNYQAKWATYRSWCRSKGHSISRPSIPKVADYLLFLRKKRFLSANAIAGHRSMLSSVFRYTFPEISSNPVLKDLIRSFKVERPIVPSHAPPWDLTKVLKFLASSAFEPLEQAPLRELTKKVLFLTSLATAKRVGELQAVSKKVSFAGNDVHLSYLPEFRAKTESEANPLPRSFVVKSLSDFVGNLPEELLLCPVRALRIYLSRTENLKPHPRSLFVSPKITYKSISKNAVSFFLREVISQSYSSGPDPGPSVRARAHSIRGMATSTSFLRNFPVSSVLAAACWKSSTVFTSFYLKDVQFSHSDGFGLGPFVAANSIIN